MAKLEGKDVSALSFDAVDMLALTTSVDFKVSQELHDITPLGTTWKTFFQGLKGGDTISWELFFDDTNTTGAWVKLCAVFNGTVAVTFSVTLGARTFAFSVFIKDLGAPEKVNNMVTVTVSLQMTGAVTFS